MGKSTDIVTEPVSEVQTENKNYLSRHYVAVVVLVSIVTGFFGGFAATAFLSARPELQHSLISGTTMQNRKVVLDEDSAIIDVVEQASPAVVSVVVSRDLNEFRRYGLPGDMFNFFGQRGQQSNTPNIQQVGAGSGFFIASNGLIVTNRHVVSDEGATYSIVTNEGKTYDAKVVARDSRNDLALMKVEITNAPTLDFADSTEVEIGQQVIAIGNSLGQYQNTVTSGIVSGIGRSVIAGDARDSEQLEGVIQTDAAINPGNSGGPLLNLAGQVIGINTAIDQQGQLVGFAIPAKDAQKAVESYNKTGKITYPFLGVRFLMLDEQVAKARNISRTSGALIIAGEDLEPAVLPNSPAEKAGFEDGDIIIDINGKTVTTQNSLSKVLKDYRIGDKLQIRIDRNGKEQTLNVVLEEAK